MVIVKLTWTQQWRRFWFHLKLKLGAKPEWSIRHGNSFHYLDKSKRIACVHLNPLFGNTTTYVLNLGIHQRLPSKNNPQPIPMPSPDDQVALAKSLGDRYLNSPIVMAGTEYFTADTKRQNHD